MIRNLNQMTFQSFGSVLSDRAQADKNNELVIPLSVDAEQVDVYQAASPTWINCSGGKAVLSVSSDGETYQDFYLDKRACVSEGIYIVLYPFKGEANVTMTSGQKPRKVGTKENGSLREDPKMRVDGLYTFFYQER